jgi:serine/threonine-protein kinase
VHSDLSRQAILLGDQDHVYLRDLPLVDNLVKHVIPGNLDNEAHSGMVTGNPSYLAPERAFALTPPDVRSDIYELGTLVYEMLIGEVPYKGATPLEILKNKDQETSSPFFSEEAKKAIARGRAILLEWKGVRNAPPSPSLDLPELVEQVVARAIARVPQQRFASAGEFASAFNAALDSPLRLSRIEG